jgi:hypothetical protein
VDRALRTLDHYLSNIKAYLQREAEALPKAKALIELSIQQQQNLQQISTNLPARLPGNDCHVDLSGPRFCALFSPDKVVVFMALITL